MKRLTGVAVLVVAAIAATVSYMHIQILAVQLGQPALAAWLLPLSVDGTVCAASAALLWSAREAIPAPRMARPMLALGVAATLAANADFGAAHGAAGIVLSAWPAIAFAGSVEVAFGMVRKSAQTDTETASVPVTDTAALAAVIADMEPDVTRTPGRTPKPAKPSAKAAAIVRRQPDVSGAELGRKLGVSERQGRRLLAQVASG
jgi:hypothetical protein